MNNISVWGNGFIGGHLKYEKIQERATTNANDIKAILKAYGTTTLINCIGYCGEKNIDDCETNKEKTIITNAIIPSIIATECEKLNIHLINISSGCIFDGNSPNNRIKYETWYGKNKGYPIYEDTGWTELDTSHPVSFYSETKVACDYLIGKLPNVFTMRIRMPISNKNSQRNFINKVLGYNKIIDIPNSVSFVSDIVRCVDWAIENKKTGIYNVVNDGTLSAANVVREYQKYVPDHKFDIINEEQLGQITKAKRSNCILDGGKLKNEGFEMGNSRLRLVDCMREYVENINE